MTPGPWTIVDSGAGFSVRGPNNECVFARDYVSEQNAALIAAAPEMYRMLRSLQRVFASPNFTDRGDYAGQISSLLATIDEAKDS